jgi:DnaK suppressor protein
MTATPRTTSTPSAARQARHLDLQAMLHDRQREMEDVLRQRVIHLPSDKTTGGLDETEQAEADTQEHIEVALIQMKGETLLRVREALERLDAGEYGYCAECGGEIAEGRLRALPFAVRCRGCEESQEQQTARERRFAPLQGFSRIFAGSTGP